VNLRLPAATLLLTFALPLWGPLRAESAPPPPDLILITIDTLRADALGFAGNQQVETPLLDRIARGGRVFRNAHAHNVVTLPSHANILTGLYPFEHGVRENSGFVLPATVPTLATVLHDAGYRTGAFVSGYPLESRFGLARGFEVYDDRFETALRGEEFALPERRGDHTVAAALAWWQNKDPQKDPRPRFLWLHLFDPHAPYDPPEPFASRYASSPYLGEVAAVDSYLAPLLGLLLSGRERRLLIAITADHGESLGEHGEATHGLFAYEATLKVPLLLWGSGVAPGVDDRPARHVDLFPSLLAAAKIAPPPAPGIAERPGRSLLATAEKAAAEETKPSQSYFESLSAALNRGWAPLRGLLAGGKKWIELPLPELYDLEADPHETRNLLDSERRTARALAAEMPSASRWPPPERGKIRSEDIASLAALGYIADSAPLRTSFGPPDDPKNLLELDQKILATIDAYSRGKLEEALKLAREVVAARPTMPLGLSLLAQSLLESRRRAEALKVMRQARQEGLASEALLRQLGLTLAEDGKLAEALEVLQPLADAGDRDARAHLALALSESGRQEEAARRLEALLEEDPGDARAQELSSLVALRRGRFEAARLAAEKAVALSPGRARAFNNLGVALFQLERRREALAAWQNAVDRDPRLVDAWWNLGVQAAKLGQKEQARRALRAFIERAPRPQAADDIAEAKRLLATLEEAMLEGKGGN